MNSDEQNLIKGLFSRLQEAERQSASRDAAAEAQINQHLANQPSAPYYMTQVILIQEAAIKRLEQQVRDLQKSAAGQGQQSSGGFLSALFGGEQAKTPAQPRPQSGAWLEPRAAQGQAAMASAPQSAAAPSQAGGFMRSALQTATGVAGGIMVAELLGNMFHHSQPQEIVEVIHEQAPAPSNDYNDSVDNASYDSSDDYSGDGFDNDSDFF